ncbi:acyl-CoA dehydrogenase [Streptomyces sp. XM4011]|uniref:acyl-CoA dehydrogenase n=1 Tax=Streptomyces sp. XM4011 TaxID=2929780 RepID=UPI001FF784A0|nr:acyl-CoA dehydrogenase [Streptomyces sp. XM4011]MCK1813235.1 acyl-CoA dehydrogenase [Streptomyces sp. XM4011]
MSHYLPNVRDIEFTLFEVLGRGEVYGRGPYADADEDTARTLLAEVARLAVDALADATVEADRTPPAYHPLDHAVSLPDSFTKAYRTWMDTGYHRLWLPPELGGSQVAPSLQWAVTELLMGANPALHMYQSFGGFASVLHALGTEEQRTLARTMVERAWGGTMVLTEADAGSDVGALRTRAVPQDDGSWHIEGVKRFITSGEHDLSENIVHFVLARPEGHGPGTKGLSMFVVPKYRVTDWATGALGARNGVRATALEDKMGLKASATVELTFGEAEPAVGYLVGERHDGIRQMFTILEHARMMVGTKAMATLSSGHRHAVAYATQRLQGADLTRATDKSAPRVPIIRHPEVRRSLLTQKAYAEGLRALVLYTACAQDDGDRALSDLLLPLVKGYGAERSWEQLSAALQILGGAGYLKDHPLEQYLRDARIDTLYEGTTAIQGMDFFFRKIARDQGAALTALAAEITAFAASEAGGGQLAAEREQLRDAADALRRITETLGGHLLTSFETPDALYEVGRNTTRLLMAAGDVVTGWLLLRGAAVAAERLTGTVRPADRAFYEGKIAAASVFAHDVLPLVAAQLHTVGRRDERLMSLPDAAF